MRRWILIGLLGLGALASCSVKEDRSDCPCWLTVEADKAISLSAWFGSHQILDNHPGGLVEHTVPRGLVEIVASHGEFKVMEGHQMDSLFAQRALVDTDGETAGYTVHLHKTTLYALHKCPKGKLHFPDYCLTIQRHFQEVQRLLP